MRSLRSTLIVTASMALMSVAGQASAGQARPRSAPPSNPPQQQSGSQSGGDRGRSQPQAQRRQAPPPPQQQRVQPQQPREQRVQPQAQRPQEQRQLARPDQRGRDERIAPRSQPQRQAVPAPRDRYIDRDRDGRNDNRDYRPNYNGRYDGRNVPRYGNARYDSRYYRGPRVIIAPREYHHFSRPWFDFRLDFRLGNLGIGVGRPIPFPSWYRPYIVGAPGYQSPYMAYGGVTFDIQPWDSEIWVDGEYIGRVEDYSPYESPLTLAAGRHWVEIRGDYGRELSFEINVLAGQVTPYQGRLG